MKENVEQEKQTPPAAKSRMGDFRKALLWTAIPIVALSVMSTALPWFAIIVWFGAAACFVAAIVAAIVYANTKGKRQITAGILAGAGIGIVALGVSCFAILA